MPEPSAPTDLRESLKEAAKTGTSIHMVTSGVTRVREQLAPGWAACATMRRRKEGRVGATSFAEGCQEAEGRE